MVIAIDLGGTNIRIAEVSGIKIKSEIKTPTPKTKKEIIDKLIYLIEKYRRQPICVSTAGEEINGKIFWALNMDFDAVPLRKILKEKFRVPVEVENDANCAALAELNFGSGKGKKNFVLLTLGTGIGGALIIDGKLYKGRGAAGEIGSMAMKGDIFEHIASGSAQTNLLSKHGLNKIQHLELQKLAEKGNAKAKKVFEEIGENLGTGIRNIIYLLDPEAVILGGGFSKVKLYWKEMLKKANEKPIGGKKTPIIKAKYGDGAGLIGAALLVN